MNDKTAQKLLEKVVKDYDKISDEFDLTREKDWEEFKEFLPFINNDTKLIDLGCGNGRFYNFIKDHKKIAYIGIDNNETLLKKAKNKFKEAKFTKGDLLKIPLRQRSRHNSCNRISSPHPFKKT
jgi:alkylated DNA repair protein alkB family protein 8